MAEIKVSVDTAGRSGALMKNIVIHSNDRTTPVMTLTVLMQVVRSGQEPGR